jgi:hypothetical protein
MISSEISFKNMFSIDSYPLPRRLQIVALLCFTLFFTYCTPDDSAQDKSDEATDEVDDELVFGEDFELDSGNTVNVDYLLSEVVERENAEKTEPVQLTGEVVRVCQSKGCWLTLVASDGTEMRIKFKDYGFFVPKDLAGNQVALEGVAWKEVTSIATLRHYAKDDGADEQELNAITSPETEYLFEASGVRIL